VDDWAASARVLPDRLPEGVRKALDALPARLTIEYLTARLGMQHGEQGLSIFVTGGRLRSANMTRNALSPDELEKLADVS